MKKILIITPARVRESDLIETIRRVGCEVTLAPKTALPALDASGFDAVVISGGTESEPMTFTSAEREAADRLSRSGVRVFAEFCQYLGAVNCPNVESTRYARPVSRFRYGEIIEGEAREIGGPTVNPFRRIQPSELIATGIAGIDLNNTIVTGQKIPFFADPDQPYNAVMANVALRAKADKIILGGMGLTNDDFLYFKSVFENAGALDRIVSFVNTTENPPVERLLVPDMALTAAEYFAVDKGEKVLVLLTDMTLYADALAIVSNRMDQIPSKDSMPGSLYSDLAKIYEKAVQLPNGGSITIIAVTTLSGGDITHAVPDNTGYITEGQLFLRNDSDTGKVIVDPFRSLSRLKQLGIGKKTREDHPQVMNACVRLYADAANAKTKLENGFDLSDYDERALKFAHDYSEKLLSIDINIDIDQMLDTAWRLFAEYFTKTEVAIKEELIQKYWKE